ncbi:M50 family metallopeptidase [Candidatus Poribacteria bacterium]|nr:M50 family metallopeptidase [Candidatus Poribacteria bacterium]
METLNRYLPLLLIFAFVTVTWFAWNTIFIYPIKLFTVTMHETGHALAASILGGKAVKLAVNRQQGGITQYQISETMQGWKKFIIASAGYLGSIIIGAILLLLSHTWAASWLPWLIGLGLLLETAFFVRDWFTAGICAIAILFFGAVGLIAPNSIRVFIAKFIATVSCCYAIFDIRDDVLRFGSEQRMGSDAHALQGLTGIPYYLWGILWIIVSIAILYKVLRFITKDKGLSVESVESPYKSASINDNK